jgi:transcription-repair coupling factor (superfamily II helicase)
MAISSVEEALSIQDDLLDRFGALDEEINEYILEVLFKKTIYRLGTFTYFEEKRTFSVYIKQASNVDYEHLLQIVHKHENEVSLSKEDSSIKIVLNLNNIKDHYYLVMARLVEEYFKPSY